MNAILELLLSTVVLFGLVGLARSLDQHRDAVGVARLDRLLQEFALLFEVPILFPVFFSLLLEALEIVKLTILNSDHLLLFSKKFLVLSEPRNLLFQLLDLTFG